MKDLEFNLNNKKLNPVRNNEYHFKGFETMYYRKKDEFNDLVNDIFEANYYHAEDEFGALYTNILEVIECLKYFLTWTMTNELYNAGLLLKKRYYQLKDQVIKYINYKGK